MHLYNTCSFFYFGARQHTPMYLVKWAGFGYKDASWEHKSVLKLVTGFKEELRRYRGHKKEVRPVCAVVQCGLRT